MKSKTVTLAIELTEPEARAIAQFLKRVSYENFSLLASDDSEASYALEAAFKIRQELNDQGFKPL